MTGRIMWQTVRDDLDVVHYSIQRLSDATLGMDALREMFKNAPNQLNFVLFSTSGVHGTYTTIEMIESEILEGQEPSQLTFVIVHPRIVVMRYGNCIPQTLEDVAFLKMLREKSREAAVGIG